MKNKRNQIIAGSVIVIVLVASIVALWLWFSTRTSSTTTPLAEVTACSISQSNVKVGELVTINCGTQNTDKNNTHVIMVRFSIQPTELIDFVMGYPSILTKPSPYVWQYTYSLNPLGTNSQPTTVSASLQTGYFSAGYEIQVTFCVDNNQFDNRTLDLTVNNS
jgi:hypothetical protein